MSTEWRGKNAKTLWVAQAKMPPDHRKEIRGIRFGDTASQNIKEAWGHKKLGVKSFTFEFQRIDDVSNLAYAQQQDLLQESDAQERRWLLALELHSYFIRKLLKNLLSPARRSNFHRKFFLWQVCYRATQRLSDYLHADA